MGRPRIRFGALTDVGRTRDHNEDAFGFRQAPDAEIAARRGDLFLVCDGMGGHAAGEVASQLAVETILDAYYSDLEADPQACLVDAIRLANARIFLQSQEMQEQRGMGTTCVASVIIGNELMTAHAGDSRAYLLRNGELFQITRDHSLVEKWVSEGLLPPEEARDHPMVNVITRALGHTPEVDVDVSRHPVYADDVLILCSDGLSGRVFDEQIKTIVLRAPDLDTAARRLIDAANDSGGPDNISVVIVHIVDADASEDGTTIDDPDTAPVPITQVSVDGADAVPDSGTMPMAKPLSREQDEPDTVKIVRGKAAETKSDSSPEPGPVIAAAPAPSQETAPPAARPSDRAPKQGRSKWLPTCLVLVLIGVILGLAAIVLSTVFMVGLPFGLG